MSIHVLGDKHPFFPPPEFASEEGILAIGGRLSPNWLIEAYRSGVFPWFNQGDPILWWSVDPRSVLLPNKVHIQKSMRPLLNSHEYSFELDRNFSEVIHHCANAPGRGKQHTWLSEDMINAYINLHRMGFAHSAEVYHRGRLVGGLYGVSLGGAFFGESMFSLNSNMSKLALIRFCRYLSENEFDFIDCQVHTQHLETLGAEPIPRGEFLNRLRRSLEKPTRKGPWNN